MTPAAASSRLLLLGLLPACSLPALAPALSISPASTPSALWARRAACVPQMWHVTLLPLALALALALALELALATGGTHWPLD